MTDLDRAIAAAREAVNRINAIPNAGMTNGEHALVHLIVALDAARYAAPAAAPVVMLPYGWHIVPRHLPDEVLVDTGDIGGYDGQRGDAEHRVWWESAIDSLAARVPCPVLTYTQAPPAAPRDESPIDIGGESVPRWIVEYANALTTYFAERGGRSWAIGGVQSREQAPPAAVPEGYAAAIKAVQEMMPPRDFRPSAQVWLTGNQVNELHARLDAAAMLAAAERKGES